MKKTHILVHYSESELGDIRSFEKYHKEVHGWPTVGYNYVIPRDGSIENYIGETAVGIHAGVTNWNEFSIGVCVTCTKEKGPTVYQMRSLLLILNMLVGRYGIPVENVLGHKEIGRDTDCPGPIQMDSLRMALGASRLAYKRFCYQMDSLLR
jgi:N-acetyl-anhydromuramyl-L-alanine amidase AmpD